MTSRTSIAAAAGLTVLGALLRLPGLDSGLWFDEIVTLVQSVRPPLRQLVTAFPGINNHPLYSLLAHLSVVTFGEHAWSLRLPALVFGVACIPLLYCVGLALTTAIESLLAALLLAVSYHGVWFSQDARGYTALLFFTLLATLLLEKLLQRPDRRLACAYAVAVALGVYTHLTMAFVAAGHGLVWAWQLSRQAAGIQRSRHLRTAILALGAAAALGGILYLPTAWQVYAVFTTPKAGAGLVATPRWAALEVLRGLRVGYGTFGVVTALALVILGAISYLRRTPVTALLFLVPGAITGVTMLIVGAPMRPRFFFLLLGFGLLMLARGAMEGGRILRLQSHTGSRIGVGAIAIITVLSGWSLRDNYRYPKQDYGGALQFIEQHRTPSELVATAGLAIYPYAQYYRTGWTPIESPAELKSLRRAPGRLWIVYAFQEYMNPGVVDTIRRECRSPQVFHGTLGGGDVVVCTLVDSAS
jgi:4-amino-4-deoxy-L-arabinose transferase-like glycosyltransferase